MKKFELRNFARFVIYCSLGTMDKLLGRENNLVVYCYHNITSNPWVFNVSRSKFEKNISYLSTTGKFISLKELNLYLEGKINLPGKNFAITFDDGYRGIKSAIQITKKFGISPTVFVLGKEKKVDRFDLKTQSNLLDKKELKTLVSSGWEIGSHGLTHKKLINLEEKELSKEVKGSKEFIEKYIDAQVNFFSYPHGKYNKQALDSVKKAGYQLGFSMNDDLVTRKTDRFTIPRVGVMGNHSDLEFKYLASPSVLGFRKAVKKTFLAKYI